MTTNHTKSTW